MVACRSAVEEVKAKVVLAGDAGVGKTSLVRRYLWNEFLSDYVATLGVVVAKRVVEFDLDARRVRVTMILWDTMGERVLADVLREAYLRDAKGVLVVCDASDPGSVSAVGTWLEAARRVAGTAAAGVVVNKCDLGFGDEARDAALRAGLENAAPCHLTSAKTGENVLGAFGCLALRIGARALLGDGPLDPVSMGMVIDASVGPRSLQDFARSTRLPANFALARADNLVRRGYLRLTSMDLVPGGGPAPTFTATGKTFPALRHGGPAADGGS